MKCKNIKKYRKVKVKKFKHTLQIAADKMSHIIGEELIVVDLCTGNGVVYLKDNLKSLYFFQIHHKDLKKIKD